MAAKAKFTDQELRDALKAFEGDPQKITKAAERLKVTPAAVSQRAKRMEAAVAPIAQRVADAAAVNVWGIRDGLQANFVRLQQLLDSVERNGVAKEDPERGTIYFLDGVTQLIALLKEARAHHETALKVMDTLYRVEETQKFMDDVLATLAEVDPAIRERCMAKIKARRTVRAAFA